MIIREFEEADWSDVWAIVEPVFRAGETYTFDPLIEEDEAYKVWIELPQTSYVAVGEDGEILGTYYIKPNQPALGAHVCNCGYIVSASARGQGVATRLCEHSQKIAREKGYRAMQFNFVVASNESAIRLWEKLGFDVVGRLPGAFNHPVKGYIDALVMFKTLI